MSRLVLLIIAYLTLFQNIDLIAQLKLIPTPKQIELKQSNFEFDSNTVIVSHKLDSFYVNDLNETIIAELELKLMDGEKPKSNYIEFIKLCNSDKLYKFLIKESLDTGFNFGDEGYILHVEKNSIKIISQEDAGIYYGIQTLKQLLKANRNGNAIPALVIYDYPDMAFRGWQDDISRGPIPTMDMLKEQIKKLASYKLNCFTLYIEHVFQLEKYPDIAPKEGITKSEIEELSTFAKMHHVNLIGSYQSFGHMEKTLSKPNYQHLAENSHIISPAMEESYEFLHNVYQEIVPVFNSNFFNINCDETFGLGEGKSKAMVDSMGLEGVYLYHINKLSDLLKPFDKSILMWGDIIAKYPHSIEQLPENITVMAWGYHAADNFEYVVSPFSEIGVDFWVAPGINCWSNIFPDFKTTEINVYNLIRDGFRKGAKGVLNTSWDDDGLNFFQNNWHGFIWGAENSWNAPLPADSKDKSDKERELLYSSFNRNYDAIFYGLNESSLVDDIVSFSNLHRSAVSDILMNSRFFDSVFPLFFDYVKKGKRECIKILEQLDEINTNIEAAKQKVRYNKVTLEYIQLAIKQVEFSLQKNLLRINLHSYLKGDCNISGTLLLEQIDQLLIDVQDIKTDYVLLWNNENRAWWLDNNIRKFDDLKASLNNLKYKCIITADNQISEKGRKVSIRTIVDDLPVYYELNKDSVTLGSMKYTEPFFIKKDVNIRACVIEQGQSHPISKDSLVFHDAIGKLLSLNSDYSLYHPSYDGGGKYALLDGRLGDESNLWSGKWQGYSGQNIDIELDFGKIQKIDSFSMGFYQNTWIWVIFPKKVEIFFKNDVTEDYQLLTTLMNSIPPEEKGSLKQSFKTLFKGVETRYLKVIAHYYGKLPEWHHAGSEYESMIFSDELIIH